MGKFKEFLASDSELTMRPIREFLGFDSEKRTESGWATLYDNEGAPYRVHIEEKVAEAAARKAEKEAQKAEKDKTKPERVKTDKEKIEDFIKNRDKNPESEWFYQDIEKAAKTELVKNNYALEKLLRSPEYRKELSAILLNKNFKDKKELKQFLRENYPDMKDKLDKYEETEYFRMKTPAGRFFGPRGKAERISDKYFTINHRPDENTVILEAPVNRLRVVGKDSDKSIIFLTDKNKGIYINLENNGLPVRNELNGEAIDTLCVKIKKDNLKLYSFSRDFDNTENLKPLNNFEDLQKLAEQQDTQKKTAYKNIKRENLDTLNSYQNIMNAVEEHHRIQKTMNTQTTNIKDNTELDKYLKSAWNGKIYTYKSGDQVIFSDNKKIVLTKQQVDYIRKNYKN